MSAAMMLASCGGTKDAGQNGTLIERSDIKIEGKRMTPEALWAMGRIGSVAVSPDEKQIAYSVAYYSVPENKTTTSCCHAMPMAAATDKSPATAGRKANPSGLKTARKSLSSATKAAAARCGR
mgnify:CR=1 FL=1